MGWNYLSIPILPRLHRWSLGMAKQFHPTHYDGCNYLSVLRLKSNHVSKRGHWDHTLMECYLEILYTTKWTFCFGAVGRVMKRCGWIHSHWVSNSMLMDVAVACMYTCLVNEDNFILGLPRMWSMHDSHVGRRLNIQFSISIQFNSKWFLSNITKTTHGCETNLSLNLAVVVTVVTV